MHFNNKNGKKTNKIFALQFETFLVVSIIPWLQFLQYRLISKNKKVGKYVR